MLNMVFTFFQILRTRTNLTKDEIPFRDKELDVRVDLKTVQRDTILYKFVGRLYFQQIMTSQQCFLNNVQSVRFLTLMKIA